jgi:hypothetical protein
MRFPVMLSLARSSSISCSFLLGLTFLFGPIRAQSPTAADIVSRLNQHDRERKALLASYTSERTYQIQYRGPMGDRNAEVHARMQFSAPDQKHFTVVSETGSQMFCHKVLRRLMEGEQEGALEANRLRAMISSDNDNLKLLGDDDLGGIKTWVLEVSPKVDSKFNYKGKVWIGKEDYAVVRVVGSPAKNPTWMVGGATFDYRYARNGEFWLPQHNVTVSHIRLGGEVTLTVDYGTYEITPTSSRPNSVATRVAPIAALSVSKGFLSTQ